MNCKTCRDEIELSDGGRPLGESATAHIESCPTCLAFRDERLTLKQMIDSLEVVTAPADFDFRLRARLAALKGREPGRIAWNRFAPGGWALSLAAAFVIVVALGVVIRQFRVNQSVNSGAQSIVKFNANNAAVPKPVLAELPKTLGHDADVAQSANTQLSQDTVLRRRSSSTVVSDVNPSANARKVNPDEGGGSVDSAVSPAANVMPLGISDPTLPRSGVAEESATGNANLDPLLARGIETRPITAELAARLNVRWGRLVVFVDPLSPASRAGIVAGDVIESIDRKPISQSNLPVSLPNKFTLEVIRNGQKLTFQIDTEINSPGRSKR